MGISPRETVKESDAPSISRLIVHKRGAVYVLPANRHSWGKIYWVRTVGSLQRNGLPICRSE